MSYDYKCTISFVFVESSLIVHRHRHSFISHFNLFSSISRSIIMRMLLTQFRFICNTEKGRKSPCNSREAYRRRGNSFSSRRKKYYIREGNRVLPFPRQSECYRKRKEDMGFRICTSKTKRSVRTCIGMISYQQFI